MANFDFDLLRLDMQDKTGYKFRLDYGEIGDDAPYREMNTIVTPIVGVFRLTPVPLTALTTPYIAVVTATVDIPAPTEMAEEIRAKLNEVAGLYNATTTEIVHEDTPYTVVYGFETCVLGDKRRDVSLYGGEIIPVNQTITYTIIEQGITALDVSIKIDGLPVPFLRLDETRIATSETAPNADGHGEIAITQDMYGLTVETPLVKNPLGDLLCEILSHGGGNVAHAVELTRNGQTQAYIMGVGTASSAMNPPANVGVTLSLAELSPQAAKFNDLWTVETVNKPVVSKKMESPGVVVWGDGTASAGDGYLVHVYTDGRTSHEVYVLVYGDVQQYGPITAGVSLFRKKIRPKNGQKINSSAFPVTVVEMDSDDKIYLGGTNRLTMKVLDSIVPIDHAIDEGLPAASWIDSPVTSLLRGVVETVNTDLLEYDRWAVTEEV